MHLVLICLYLHTFLVAYMRFFMGDFIINLLNFDVHTLTGDFIITYFHIPSNLNLHGPTTQGGWSPGICLRQMF